MAASEGNLDVAIIGGGIAGLYCLYRLLRDSNYKNRNIKLFEASDHLGGRIETWSLMREVPGKHDTGFTDTWDPRLPLWDGCHATPGPYDPLDKLDCFRAEFGPMRIEPRDQPLLRRLLDELGITEQAPGQPESLDDLIPFFSYASEEPQSLKFNLQGEEAEQKSTLDLLLLGIWRVLEILDGQDTYAWKDPIATTAWNNMLSGKSFYRHYWKSELIEWINHLKDCEQGPCTPDNSDYQRIRQQFKINGHQLWDLGFWNLMSDVLSHYAVVKIRDWGTYYHFLHANLNAAEWLIFWLKAIKGTRSLRGIRGGMSRLIYALQLELCKLSQESSTSAPGNRLPVADERRREERESLKKYIEINRQLKKITLNDQSKMIECIFGEGESEKVLAHEVILALPKRPLERLQLPDLLKTLPDDSKAIEGALRSVKCLQLLKCFFILEDPWWEDDRNLNKYAGDVPTREIAYYKSKDKTKGIIMIYTDHPAITFWSDYLREFEKAADDSQAIYKVWWRNEFKEDTNEGKQQKRLWDRFVQFARDYEHHDFSTDRLLACGIRDWGKDPFGGAAHGWLPGERSWIHIDYLAAFPTSNGTHWKNKLHICGEAFSDHQGFIEGSLRSAEETLFKMGIGRSNKVEK